MKHYYNYIHPKLKTFHGVIIKGRSYWINKSNSKKKVMSLQEILEFKIYRDKIRGKEVKKLIKQYKKNGKFIPGDKIEKTKRRKRKRRKR